MTNDIITLECDVRARTKTGLLLRFGGPFGDEIWFDLDKVNENDDGTVSMSEAYACRKEVDVCRCTLAPEGTYYINYGNCHYHPGRKL